MLEKFFNTPNLTVLNKVLDASTLKGQVIANNIANNDTPNFKRSEVIFEDKLKAALASKKSYNRLRTTDEHHMQVGKSQSSLEDFQPDVETYNYLTYRNDGNNVDIDYEMAESGKNKILYDAVVQSMNNEFTLLRMAITGRG